jgi:hypothetical protein
LSSLFDIPAIKETPIMHWIDPDSLPEVSGTLERFVINPHGEIDGFVMQSGGRSLLAHTPPHLHAALETAFAPGDAIRVRGVRPRGADLIAGVAVIAADGRSIVDDGPDHHDHHDGDKRHKKKHPPHHERKAEPKSKKLDAAGRVRLSLFGPKGELRGALLDDGTVVRIGPKEAEAFAALLAPGAALAVRGEGRDTAHGVVVVAAEIGADPSSLKRIEKKPKPKH